MKVYFIGLLGLFLAFQIIGCQNRKTSSAGKNVAPVSSTRTADSQWDQKSSEEFNSQDILISREELKFISVGVAGDIAIAQKTAKNLAKMRCKFSEPVLLAKGQCVDFRKVVSGYKDGEADKQICINEYRCKKPKKDEPFVIALEKFQASKEIGLNKMKLEAEKICNASSKKAKRLSITTFDPENPGCHYPALSSNIVCTAKFYCVSDADL